MVWLGDVCRVINGYAFNSKCFNIESRGNPIIRIRDVVRGYTETYTTEQYKDTHLVKFDDLIIGMDGEFNIAKWKSKNALLNQRVCRLDVDNSFVNAGYLLYCLPQKLKEIEAATPFVTVKHLSSKTIEGILIALPPLDVQERIADILDRANTLIEKRKAQIAKLDLFVKSQFKDRKSVV
jgi:type I restriction enzyme S subunit